MMNIRVEGDPREVDDFVWLVKSQADNWVEFGNPSQPYHNRNKSSRVRVYMDAYFRKKKEAITNPDGIRPVDCSDDELLDAAAKAAFKYLAPIGFTGKDIEIIRDNAEDGLLRVAWYWGVENISEAVGGNESTELVGSFFGYAAAAHMLGKVNEARSEGRFAYLPRFGPAEIMKLEDRVTAAVNELEASR